MTAAWGSTFFMIKDVVTRIPVPDLLTIRFAIAALALAVIAGPRLKMSPDTLRRGLLLGLLYGIAQLLQTFGLAHTAASVSGFLTGLYVVLTPLLSAMILSTRITPAVWAAPCSRHWAGSPVPAGIRDRLRRAPDGRLRRRLRVAHRRARADERTRHRPAAECGADGRASPRSAGRRRPGRHPATTSAADWAIVLYLALIAGALTMLLQTWAQARVEASQKGRGDHGDGTGLGGRLRGRLRRREPDRPDDRRRRRHPGRHVPGGARPPTPTPSCQTQASLWRPQRLTTRRRRL